MWEALLGEGKKSDDYIQVLPNLSNNKLDSHGVSAGKLFDSQTQNKDNLIKM